LGSALLHHTRAAIAAALLLCVPAETIRPSALASNDLALGARAVEGASETSFEQFLDHLMRAESSGRDTAANPRSTALGAFQFIETTFLAVAREYFAREVAELSDQPLLALRTIATSPAVWPPLIARRAPPTCANKG
jgi:hypothetical protein